MWIVPVLLVGVLVAALLTLATTPFQAVTRARVERFARRQSLPITVANGQMVIRYLATTRRWRGTGLLLTVVGGMAYSVARHRSAPLSATALFAGWFVGAVIAEWRVSTAGTPSGLRSASLVPRRLSDYLSRTVRWVSLLVGAATVGLELAGQALTARHGELAGLTAVTVATLICIGLVTRHVLGRPQIDAPGSVLAADESIRSRSLHVLFGSLLATCGYVSGLVLDLTVARDPSGTRHNMSGLWTLVIVLYAVFVASSASMLPRRAWPSRTRSMAAR
jgi:hypothetical protein